MIIGVSKEIENNENRVAITPAGAEAFVKNGYRVIWFRVYSYWEYY